ncbi:hypothetical protein I302_108069 [Kwoniella bestiolae CBS 10118]|uniref:Uncharacterized protein n=1 Tax=Kwoniella bestiolae CBS 10118 TaxID=1296100 RepID=A0A1B9FWS4_9TREE|nr:hypothetical protein I302_07565 [Kwoniella bestiolae CBS 10118]OCF23211.1 hypothetical protein I302_07565 [Kwoniella bestiolae CBS 10118]
MSPATQINYTDRGEEHTYTGDLIIRKFPSEKSNRFTLQPTNTHSAANAIGSESRSAFPHNLTTGDVLSATRSVLYPEKSSEGLIRLGIDTGGSFAKTYKGLSCDGPAFEGIKSLLTAGPETTEDTVSGTFMKLTQGTRVFTSIKSIMPTDADAGSQIQSFLSTGLADERWYVSNERNKQGYFPIMLQAEYHTGRTLGNEGKEITDFAVDDDLKNGIDSSGAYPKVVSGRIAWNARTGNEGRESIEKSFDAGGSSSKKSGWCNLL